jgi:hypothetical protein
MQPAAPSVAPKVEARRPRKQVVFVSCGDDDHILPRVKLKLTLTDELLTRSLASAVISPFLRAYGRKTGWELGALLDLESASLTRPCVATSHEPVPIAIRVDPEDTAGAVLTSEAPAPTITLIPGRVFRRDETWAKRAEPLIDASAAGTRILAYGDSLTAGYHAQGLEFAPWAPLLRPLLGAAVVEHCGLSGATVRELVEAADAEVAPSNAGAPCPGLRRKMSSAAAAGKPYDVVLLLGGTNDLADRIPTAEIVDGGRFYT